VEKRPLEKSYGPVTEEDATVGANSKELVEIAGTQRAPAWQTR